MILCDNFIFELQTVGGVSRVWAKNIERLDKMALDLYFLEGSGAKNNVFRRELTLTHPIISESSPTYVRRFLGSQIESDIFHSSYYRISKKARFNVVTIHDFMNELFPSNFRDPLLAYIKKRACNFADRIIVVSERTKQDLLRHYPDINSGIVEVVYNGVDEEFFPEPFTAPFVIGEELIEPQGYFLYVGTRGYCKNFPYVLSFMAEARKQGLENRLVIVGSNSLSADEYAYATSLGLSTNTFLHLYGINNISLRQLYSNCTALLIPSIYEGFGLPALEAARCGALVLAARGSALDEIVGETEYSFDLNRKDEILRVLALGFDNTTALTERARIQERSNLFSWDNSVQRLAEIYNEFNKR